MPSRNTSALAILLMLAACLGGCLTDKAAPGPQSRGGGSETTLTGLVRDAAGNPVAGAALRLRPQDDPPPNLFSADTGEAVSPTLAVTAADGSYRLEGVADGEWFLECRAGQRTAAVLRVETGMDGQKDSLNLPDAVLQPTASVRGVLEYPGDSGFATDSYVYIPGLWKRTLARQANGHAFELTDIPAGSYTLIFQPAYPGFLARWKILEMPLTLDPGQALDLDTVTLPLRKALQDPAYSRDSAAAWAFHLAALDSGVEPDPHWVLIHTAVSGNRITMLYDFGRTVFRIPPEVKALDALEVLYIMGFDDSLAIPFPVAPEVSTLPRLKRLWLPKQILAPLPVWPGTFPELASLDLGGTGLKTFPDWVLEVKTLTTLYLSGHGYTTLPPGFGGLKKLQSLDLSGNAFTSVPAVVNQLPRLQALRMRGNKLCGLDAPTRAWVSAKDSIWQAQSDPLMPKDTVGWEASQECGP